MSSSRRGASISRVDVTNIGARGFWFMVEDREYYVPFPDYPAFLDATVAQIHNVRLIGPGQCHWPDLDIDIELEALEHPERFPLTYK